MHALQTLVLSCEHLDTVLPVLDLAALPTLAYLILDHVYPQRLTLPQQCSLDLRCWACHHVHRLELGSAGVSG